MVDACVEVLVVVMSSGTCNRLVQGAEHGWVQCLMPKASVSSKHCIVLVDTCRVSMGVVLWCLW